MPNLSDLLRSSAQPRSHFLYSEPAPTRRNMTPAEQEALWAQGEQGLQPTVAPLGPVGYLGDMFGQFADEALGNMALPAMLLGAVAAPKVAAKGRKALSGKSVLDEAASPTKGAPSYAAWRYENPSAGADLFDFSNLQPAIQGRPALPRYQPKNGPPPRLKEALANPTVRKKLEQGALQGMDMMPESWYRTSPLYDEFKRIYGADAENQFVSFMEHIAATSPGMSVPNNIRTGSYYWHLAKQGLPVPDKPAPGYGAKTQQLHMDNARELRGGHMDPFKRPKASSFVENLVGNEDMLTADTHAMRAVAMSSKDPRFLETAVTEVKKLADGSEVKVTVRPRQMYESGQLTLKDALKQPTYWASAPQENEYAYLEDFVQKMAKRIGPKAEAKLGRPIGGAAEVQDKMWVGMGGMTGLASPPEPWLRTFVARVVYTAHRMGADPKVVMEKAIRGDIPLLSLPAGILGGAAALQQGQEPQGSDLR